MRGDLSAELRNYLFEALYAHPVEFRRNAHWVMNAEWWRECRNMTSGDGFLLWEPPRTHILGLPIEIREDGGAPHLEAATTTH